MGKFIMTYVDHDGERSNASIGIVELNAGNIAAQLALVATLQAAIEAICVGNLDKTVVSAITTDLAAVPPASGLAQREAKWLVSGVDTQGLNCSIEIPTADLTLLPAGSGVLDLSAGVGLALANALNAVWVSKINNPVTVARVIHVGRNI